MKLLKNILPTIFVALLTVFLFSCQKGGEPVPYGDSGGSGELFDGSSTENQRGDQTGDTGTTTEQGTKGGSGGGGTPGGDDNVIGGDDNEDDDDVVEDFDLGGGDPKNDDNTSSGNGGV